MAHHDLRLRSEFFDHSERGDKPFEVRYDDRGYRVGDTIRMREVVERVTTSIEELHDEINFQIGKPARKRTTRELVETGRIGKLWRVTYIYSGVALLGGFVVLGLREVVE